MRLSNSEIIRTVTLIRAFGEIMGVAPVQLAAIVVKAESEMKDSKIDLGKPAP